MYATGAYRQPQAQAQAVRAAEIEVTGEMIKCKHAMKERGSRIIEAAEVNNIE